MILSHLQEHREKNKPEEHSDEQIKLMRTQDYKYITMKRTIEKNKINRLKSQLHFIDEAKSAKNSHIHFTDEATKKLKEKSENSQEIDHEVSFEIVR